MTLPPAPPTIASVTEAICEIFRVTNEALIGRKRAGNICAIRAAAFMLVREITASSYADIGTYFGNRSHATILSAIKGRENIISSQGTFHAQARQVRNLFPTPSQSQLF